jgi:hypothetical protein
VQAAKNLHARGFAYQSRFLHRTCRSFKAISHPSIQDDALKETMTLLKRR